jgi:hypothetical protein
MGRTAYAHRKRLIGWGANRRRCYGSRTGRIRDLNAAGQARHLVRRPTNRLKDTSAATEKLLERGYMTTGSAPIVDRAMCAMVGSVVVKNDAGS